MSSTWVLTAPHLLASKSREKLLFSLSWVQLPVGLRPSPQDPDESPVSVPPPISCLSSLASGFFIDRWCSQAILSTKTLTSLAPELIHSPRLPSRRASAVLLSSCLQSGNYRPVPLCPFFKNLGPGDGSGPHVYTNIFLPTKSSPQPPRFLNYHVCFKARRPVVFPTICSTTVRLFSVCQSSSESLCSSGLCHLPNPLLLRDADLSPLRPTPGTNLKTPCKSDHK